MVDPCPTCGHVPGSVSQELARKHRELAIDTLVSLLEGFMPSVADGPMRSAAKDAAKTILEFADGRPAQSITGPGGGPVEVAAKLVVVMPDNGRGR